MRRVHVCVCLFTRFNLSPSLRFVMYTRSFDSRHNRGVHTHRAQHNVLSFVTDCHAVGNYPGHAIVAPSTDVVARRFC